MLQKMSCLNKRDVDYIEDFSFLSDVLVSSIISSLRFSGVDVAMIRSSMQLFLVSGSVMTVVPSGLLCDDLNAPLNLVPGVEALQIIPWPRKLQVGR